MTDREGKGESFVQIFQTVEAIKEYAKAMKAAGKTIALVPTMGALHEGHIALMEAARKAADVVIASVFVNPTQFGPNEDYDAYPRTFAADCEKLGKVPVDAVFHPEPAALYPEGYATYVTVEGDIVNKLCGAKRPGHFRGVATVGTKLIHLSCADKVFFGQKDAQQVVVVRRVAEDLNLPVEIVMVPIVREASGLAMSSRNRYLSAEEKTAALVLSKSLRAAEKAFRDGEWAADNLTVLVTAILKGEPLATIDYVALYAFPSLRAIERVERPALLAIAVKIGKTRLIDNVILGRDASCC